MAHPLVLGLSAVALGWLGKKWYDDHVQNKAQQDHNHYLGLGAKELTQGKIYTMSIQLNPAAVTTSDLKTMADVIATSFRQMGFDVNGTAAPRSNADASKFIAGQQSEWLVQGKWTRPEKTIPSSPPWAGLIIAYEAPTV